MPTVRYSRFTRDIIDHGMSNVLAASEIECPTHQISIIHVDFICASYQLFALTTRFQSTTEFCMVISMMSTYGDTIVHLPLHIVII